MASALTVLFLGFWLAGCSAESGAGRQPASPRSQHLPQPSHGREKERGLPGAVGKKNGHFGGQQSTLPEPWSLSHLPPGKRVTPTEGSYPKPSISVSPGGVIPVGGNVTIRCHYQLLGMRILLYKVGAGNYLNYTDPAGSEAEFPITSARREHGGNYTCRYSNRTGPAAYSEPSDPVQIIVAEPSYPKPSISLSPSGGVSLGGAVTVRCQGQHQGMRFVLNKERRRFPPVDSDGLEVVFPISNVSWEHGGSYSCFYHSRSEPFNVSYPSDPMELVVRDPSLPRPSISLSPTGVTAPGADVTIRCQGPHWDVRFFLHKAGDLNLQRHMDPAGAGAEFRIPSVGQQHGGSYSCSYQNRSDSEPFVSSQPSDPVQLVVTGGTYPTQSGTAPTSPCSGSAKPDTKSKGSESPSITPKTEGTTSAGPKQLNPPTTEPDGEVP
ncbi:immunoglobulin superfamily member 1-like [Mauremys mutica]|uniref:immunoglobulin superfamily member 1-like n=1 Tax=Mauremys mutica TaxID=74926 RepID=UPI001D168E79|nr:immunoglobulin superfamily member 1-like [Mauremys mutica]